MIPDKFCFHCGDLDPEYTVEDYARRCTACGESTVVNLVEAIDLLNHYWELDNYSIPEDMIDEEFNIEALDFDSPLELNFEDGYGGEDYEQ